MQDGLYLSNQWVAEVDCALTFQGNDITKPDALTASYSNSFTLPDTTLIRGLLGNAEQIDAGGLDPYQQLPARLIDEGEVVFSGIAELVSFQGGWKVNLLDSLVAFFDAIADKKLTDLKLDRLNHPWTFDYINHFAGGDTGIVYPVIDYGSFDGTTFPYDTLTPAVYVKTIAQQIASEAGYTLVGDWLSDAAFTRMALPFVNSEPVSHDDDWVRDRSSRVTTANSTEPQPIRLENGHPIDIVLPFSNDNDSVNGYTDGKLNCYKADRMVYITTEAMRVAVQASVNFVYIVLQGAPEVKLYVTRNGQKVAEAYWSEAGYTDHLTFPETLKLDTEIDCRAGDELQLRLSGNARTTFASYLVLFSPLPGDMWGSFIPDPKTRLGDEWVVPINLPDLACSDLMLTIAKVMSGYYIVNNTAKTLELFTLNQVLAQESNAQDWSVKVDSTEEPELLTKLDGYGQKNLLKWKEPSEQENIGFGDGVILCDVKTLPAQISLFELPFAACIDSSYALHAYGNPILIRTRNISGAGTNITVEKVSALPRIILMEPGKTFTVQSKTINEDGTIIPVTVTLTGCWWGKRPVGVVTQANSLTLAFDSLGGGEQTLIGRYFGALKRILRRPRQFTVSMYLKAEDIAALSLKKPVRLRKVRAGSLDINDNYFLVNQVNQYQAGKTNQVVLIAY